MNVSELSEQLFKSASPEFIACLAARVPITMTVDENNPNKVIFTTDYPVGFERDEKGNIIVVRIDHRNKTDG